MRIECKGDRVSMSKNEYGQVMNELNQYKSERDTLIDDLSKYEAKVSRLEQIREIKDNALKGADIKIKTLERENHDFKKRNALLMNTVDDLDKENKALRIQSNTYFDEWQSEKLTSQGLREQCKEYVQDASKYTVLTNHIRLKAETNPGVSRYIDLVNYIDRLEHD
ncbi:hypothetical protein QI090_12000 [Staphylococcus saprophyticus]|nr:hypothetical protein [Staphylococcus saprophyticus]